MGEMADFRSDTVTRPTAAMRHAMAEAMVDDDVLGHDPTTLELEQESAHLVDKEEALFVPSGTMANLMAIMAHARPGEEVILEEWAHSSRFEAGGAGAVAGVQLRTLRSNRGLMDAGEIGEWISDGTEHTPRTALICVEQTHNFHGGTVLPIDGLREIYEVCRGSGVPVHMDGARLWNAAAATDIPGADYAALADTVSFCLSKGLCAPVGSVLCGSAEFIAHARKARKRLGGGMRQSGVIAAAGLVALREMRGRLKEDHLRAARIARTLSNTGSFSVDADAVRTNIVFVNTGIFDASPLVEEAASHGLLFLATGPRQVRIVTHNDVDDDDVERLITLFSKFSG
ncbi:threonine aldolase family protein [Thermodesulfobacteriota bacterium]